MKYQRIMLNILFNLIFCFTELILIFWVCYMKENQTISYLNFIIHKLYLKQFSVSTHLHLQIQYLHSQSQTYKLTNFIYDSWNCITYKLSTIFKIVMPLFPRVITLVTKEFMDTCRFLRSMTGLRKALTVLSRSPFLVVSWELQ